MALILDKFIEPIKPAFGPEAAAIFMRGIESFSRNRMETQRLRQNKENLDRRLAAETALAEKELGFQREQLEFDRHQESSQQRQDMLDRDQRERIGRQRDDVSRAELRLKQDAATRATTQSYVDSLNTRLKGNMDVLQGLIGAKLKSSGGEDKGDATVKILAAIQAQKQGSSIADLLERTEALGLQFDGKAEDLFPEGSEERKLIQSNLDSITSTQTELGVAIKRMGVMSTESFSEGGFRLPTTTEPGVGENPQTSTSGEVEDNPASAASPTTGSESLRKLLDDPAIPQKQKDELLKAHRLWEASRPK